MKHKYRAFHALTSKIDAETGLIKGVKIMSIGAAKGHGMLVDQTTLEQVLACIKTYKSGLKVKFNPETFNHGDGGIAGIVPVDSCRIEAGVLVGDMQLSKNYPYRAYVLELAETMPDTFGLSIDFSGEDDIIDGTAFARCSEIYAVTIVDEPAANDGLAFRALEEPPPAKTNKAMTDEEMKKFKEMLSETNAPLAQSLASMAEAGKATDLRLKALESAIALAGDDKEPDCEGMSDEEKDDEMAVAGVLAAEKGTQVAFRKVNKHRQSLSQPITAATLQKTLTRFSAGMFRTMGGKQPIGGAGEGGGDKGGDKKGQKGFMELVDKACEAGIDRRVAIHQLSAKHSKEFAEYRKNQEAKLGKRGTKEEAA